MAIRQLAQAKTLLRQCRWGALATLDTNQLPFASMVAYGTSDQGLIFHLSQLAAHTKNLIKNPQASLVISEQDGAIEDPQTLARLTLNGKLTQIEKSSDSYPKLKSYYLEKLPQSEPLFDFPDFTLWQMQPHEGRFVGGFANAYTIRELELDTLFGEDKPERMT